MSGEGQSTKPQSDASTLFEGYLTELEYCSQRGISRRTAQRERRMRDGAPHVVIGRQVFYRVQAIREWMLKREIQNDRRKLNVRRGPSQRQRVGQSSINPDRGARK